MKYYGLALTATLIVGTTIAEAVVIKPTGATASSEFSSSYLATNTINGSGLTGAGTNVAEAHAAYSSASGGNHWTTTFGPEPTAAFIDWTFATPQSIGAAYIWNHQSNGGLASNPGYDVTLFDLTFFNAANIQIASFNDLSLAPDVATAQRIDFALIAGVSRIRFDVEAVQSSPNYTGLAEVAFDTQSFVAAVIPEPATWAMMVGGFGLAGAGLRRRARVVSLA